MFSSLFEYLYHQSPEGGIPLKGTGIVLGTALIVGHLIAFLRADGCRQFLSKFPRSYPGGVVLLTVGFLWSMLLITNMDMGEFYTLRPKLQAVIPAAYVAVLIYVREFLAVRALGALLLLLAGPVLAAAFLQPPASRLLLPALAYAWIIAGMFMVGMPYLLRDWIQWVSARAARWNGFALGGVVYGAAILIAALVAW